MMTSFISYGVSIKSKIFCEENFTIEECLKNNEDIYIYENTSYLSLKELYQNIYSDYLRLKEQKQDFSNQFCATKLAEKYNFTPNNILRIIQIMSDDVIGDYWKKNLKI